MDLRKFELKDPSKPVPVYCELMYHVDDKCVDDWVTDSTKVIAQDHNAIMYFVKEKIAYDISKRAEIYGSTDTLYNILQSFRDSGWTVKELYYHPETQPAWNEHKPVYHKPDIKFNLVDSFSPKFNQVFNNQEVLTKQFPRHAVSHRITHEFDGSVTEETTYKCHECNGTGWIEDRYSYDNMSGEVRCRNCIGHGTYSEVSHRRNKNGEPF